MNKKTLITSTVLLFPIIVLLGVVGLNIHAMNNGDSYRIKIEGYDPRDLLRGHYMIYRYAWNWDDGAGRQCERDNCSLCLSGDEYNPFARLVHKDIAPEQCKSFIHGISYGKKSFRIGRSSHNGLTRFYVPESHARDLDRMIRRGNDNKHDFDIKLRVNGQGRAFIQDMYIDDVPFQTWLKNNPIADQK